MRTEEYGGAVYLITTRDINRGEPLLGYWEWEADDENPHPNPERTTFRIADPALGELVTVEGEAIDV